MKVLTIFVLLLILGGVGVVLYLHFSQPPAGLPTSRVSGQESATNGSEAAANRDAPVKKGTPPQSAAESAGPREGIRLFGTVIDAGTNAPIPNAVLRARAASQERRSRGQDKEAEPPSPPETISDQNGAFSLMVPADGFANLVCTATGYARSQLPFSGTQGASVRIDFQLRPGSVVAGVVSDKDTQDPVARVRVRVLGAQETLIDIMRSRGQDDGDTRTAQTGTDGHYRLEGLPPGPYRIVLDAREAGYLFEPENAVALEVAAATEYEHVDFALERGGVVTGFIRNSAGTPVENASVTAMPTQVVQSVFRRMNALDASGFEPRRATTGADGGFKFIGVEYDSELRLVGVSDDYATTQSEPFTLTRTTSPVHVDLTMTRGSTVSGAARHPDGTPAGDERLMLFPESGEGWSGFTGPATDTTDKTGAFQIAHVRAGSYFIRSDREFGRSRVRREPQVLPVTVDGVTDIAGLEIVVESEEDYRAAETGSGTINGTVTDEKGAPVPEIRVEAKRADNPRQTAGASTEVDGTFALTGLSGGMYDLSVDDEAGIAREPGVTVGSTVTIRLAPPAVVGGLVVDAQGEPVAGATVQLKDQAESGRPANMATLMRGLFNQGPGGETTDSYGRFEFRKVAPGDYTVAAQSVTEGTASTGPFAVTPGLELTNLHLVLVPGITFSGIVVGVAGEPVSGALVQLVPSGENPTADMMSQFLPAAMVKTAGSTSSGASGEFTIRNVPPGNYKLVASHSDYAKTTIPGVQVNRGLDVTGYRVSMGKGGQARGAYLVDGKPQAGAMIILVGASGIEMLQTDSQGMFDVTGIPAGSYMLSAFNPAQLASGQQNMQFKPQVVDIADGQATHVDLGSAAGVPVSGAVTGASGSMTVVALRRPGGPSMETLDVTNIGSLIESMRYLAGQSALGPDGTFSIDGVEPGEYVLEVYSFDFDQQNPDMMALMNMSRTPVYRQPITVGAEPPVVEISLGQS